MLYQVVISKKKDFTVYDYKFGFDPGADERAFEEYPFSIGGSNLALAMDLFDGVKPYGISINENKVIKDLAKADEVIKMIKMMNPDVKADLLMKIARMGQDKMKESINEGDLFSSEFDRPHLKDIIRDLNKGLILDMPTRRAYKFLVSLLDKEDKEELGLNENMYIDDEEFEMEMGRSKKDSLRKEMMIHVSELLDGNIDRNDFMNVVDDIMAELELNEIDIDSVSNDPGSGDADNPTGEELEAGSGYDAVEENIVKEGVVKKLRTLLKNKGSESQIDAYLKSLNNDIRLNGYDDYEDFDDDDWVEDYEEYINDKNGYK